MTESDKQPWNRAWVMDDFGNIPVVSDPAARQRMRESQEGEPETAEEKAERNNRWKNVVLATPITERFCGNQTSEGFCILGSGPPMSNFGDENGKKGWRCIAAGSRAIQQDGCGKLFSSKLPDGQSETGTLK